MDLKLEGRACLVTGASSGIGRGIATMLAAEGVKLALGGRNLQALEELRSQLISRGSSDIVICIGDVATKEGVQQVTGSAMRALGRIDMLVNNAGGSHPIAIGKNGVNDIDDSVWDESFGLNFNAARRMTAAIAPSMIEQGWGRIVNLTGAVFAASMNTATPAKAALQSWSKALASQLAPHGITVNCVAPGRIHSRQIDEKLHPTAESRDAYIKANIPSGYFGEPEDVASVVTFLLSPLSRYVTGSTIHIDGGLYRLAP